MLELPAEVLLGAGGIVIGGLFGIISQRTNFCTAGAISDFLLLRDRRRMLAWGWAIAIALLASQAMHAAGWIDLLQAPYRS